MEIFTWKWIGQCWYAIQVGEHHLDAWLSMRLRDENISSLTSDDGWTTIQQIKSPKLLT